MASPSVSEAENNVFSDWTIHDWAEASSTNDLARQYPAWHIIRCSNQTNGRGRFNRTWFGTPGGLWVSYNVPLLESSGTPTTGAVHWGHLPIVAGLALLDYLKGLGVSGVRLRWPNDLLVGKSKLAGILVERPRAELAVIGIGLNVFNNLEPFRAVVKDPAIRLADCLSDCPDLDEVTQGIASCLQKRWMQFSAQGLTSLLPALNESWDLTIPVRIETDEEAHEGIFDGITSDGSPIIKLKDGTTETIPGYLINRLLEI